MSVHTNYAVHAGVQARIAISAKSGTVNVIKLIYKFCSLSVVTALHSRLNLFYIPKTCVLSRFVVSIVVCPVMVHCKRGI